MYEQIVLSIIDVVFNNITSMTIGAVCTVIVLIISLKR